MLLQEDRILSLSFSSSFSLVVELFSKGSNLYLLDDKNQILSSYVPQKKTIYNPPPLIPFQKSILLLPSFEKTEEFFQKKEEELLFASEKTQLMKDLHHKLRRTRKSLQSLEEQTDLWEQKQKEAILLQSHFHQLKKGLASIEVEDWDTQRKITLSLDPQLEPKEQLAAYFAVANKWKKRKIHVENSLERLKTIQATLEKEEATLIAGQTLEEIRRLRQILFPAKKPLSSEEKVRREKFHLFHSQEGLPILVGKSAIDNEYLTFRVAKGNDYWFHAKDFSGSHVILQRAKGKEPNQESLLDAALLALYYSKGKERQEGEVVVTQVKSLKKSKGSPGQVSVGSHRSLFIRLDPERLSRLRNILT